MHVARMTDDKFIKFSRETWTDQDIHTIELEDRGCGVDSADLRRYRITLISLACNKEREKATN